MHASSPFEVDGKTSVHASSPFEVDGKTSVHASSLFGPFEIMKRIEHLCWLYLQFRYVHFVYTCS